MRWMRTAAAYFPGAVFKETDRRRSGTRFLRNRPYSVTKVLDTRHNPEFTLMELYQAFTDYHGMMDLAENLYRFVAQEVLAQHRFPTESMFWIWVKPFERITMLDAVKKYAGVDFNEIHSDEEAKAVAREHHIEFEERHKKGDILSLSSKNMQKLI